MRANDLRRINEWTADEDATASNLYERGVQASDIADTINRLYRRGRTKLSVRARMSKLRVTWAARVNEVDSADLVALCHKRALMRRGGMRSAELHAAAERTQPYHPLNDNPRLLTLLNMGAR